MMNSFRVASYNILATSYVRPQWYTHVASAALSWNTRKFALAEKIESQSADIICLQEVEAEAYLFLQRHLAAIGYLGLYAQKTQGKPDGCATFFKVGELEVLSNAVLYYNDGLGETLRSGHLALLTIFGCPAGVIGVANTHLKWDSAGKSPEAHIGYRQVRELLENCFNCKPGVLAWVVCGDLNAQSGSPVVNALIHNGFEDAYQGYGQPTCNSNRKTKRIDYLFHTPILQATPDTLIKIDNLTSLPSAEEPSDHLAIGATFVIKRFP